MGFNSGFKGLTCDGLIQPVLGWLVVTATTKFGGVNVGLIYAMPVVF